MAGWKNGRPHFYGHTAPFSLAAVKPEAGLDAFIRLAWKDAPADVLDRFQVVLAIDAPLSFPKAFVDFLCGKDVERPALDCFIENRLAFRDCDRHIADVFKKAPLSASFDKLGNPATVAMLYARRWARDGKMFVLPFDDAPDDASIIIEVYPATAKDEKTGDCEERFRRWIDGGIEPRTDAFDACLCALMALAFRSENPKVLPKLVGPEAGDDMSKREGWIYYPEQRHPRLFCCR